MIGRRAADLAVDLGTSNTRVAAAGRGVLVDEPSVVALRRGAGGREVVAVGAEAKRMLGRTPSGTEVVRPLRGGVIADFESTEQLLRHLMRAPPVRSLLRPRVLVCIPSGTTEVERRAVQESARAAGSREVWLVDTCLAAAIGADLPVSEAIGSMIVDLGGGSTEVAVVSLGGIVVHKSARLAGDDLDDAVSSWLRRRHNLVVGGGTAEIVKQRVGCAAPPRHAASMYVRGRDLGSGVPREVEVTTDEMVAALADPIARIRALVLDALAETPPELAADIHDRGIVLCGGSALLVELDHVLREATALPVLQAEEPLRSVVRGAARLLEDPALFERVVASA